MNFVDGKSERVLSAFRPSAASIVVRPIRPIVIFVLGFAILWWYAPASPERTLGLAVLLGLLILRVLWEAVWVLCARYELTNLRVRATTGVFARFAAEIPLARVQNTFLSKSLFERLAGIGSIGIASAGTGGVEVLWSMIDNPGDVLARVREQLDRAVAANNANEGLGDEGARQPAPAPAPDSKRPIVLGLVGGIGAGKSAVAKELESRGALVLDSDSRAKAVLETPEARDALVSWWGPDILQNGRVDRKRVADIVFSDQEQRRRLEAFVHPRLREARRAEIEAAGARGVRVVVIDAPLLLEAGVDKECDAVVFVDAPREQRVERVRSRGWDEAELARREAAQMPLDQKRRASAFVVRNEGDRSVLSARVEELMKTLDAGGIGQTRRS